jgi:6-phosphogluconolactonase
MGSAPELRVLNDEQKLAYEAADLIVWLAEQTIGPGGLFRIALSGGNTPRLLHGMLAGPTFRRRLNWSQVQFYFGDERCVPPTHPDSNFAMAEETLLRPLDIASERVFRVPSEKEPEAAAQQYEALLRERFSAVPPAWPKFHLILLGLGEDGHTASLFPGSPALSEQKRAVVATRSPKGVTDRITLTLPVINHAQAIVFLVAGANKAEAVQAVLEDARADPIRYPAKFVQPTQGRLIWLLDREAASQLAVTKQQVVSEEE